MFSYVQAVKKAVAKMEQWQTIAGMDDMSWRYGNLWQDQFPKYYGILLFRNTKTNKEI